MIRPIPGQTALVSPRNGLTVWSDRPVFAWTATPGQTYELMLELSDARQPASDLGEPRRADRGQDDERQGPEPLVFHLDSRLQRPGWLSWSALTLISWVISPRVTSTA